MNLFKRSLRRDATGAPMRHPSLRTGCTTLADAPIGRMVKIGGDIVSVILRPETTVQAAARETREEACAEVAIQGLYTLINLPHINQVYMIFLADLEGGFDAGPESLEVALFQEHEIPWEELAFRSITSTLQHFYRDRRAGAFSVHADVIQAPGATAG